MAVAYRSIDPNTGEVIKTYDNHSDAELANALTAADGVYRSEWSRGPIERRLDVVSRLADRIAERGEELARIVVREMGKRIAEARREVALIAEIARYYAENAAAFLAPARLETRLGEACVEYHPIGVVVAIEPWNYPLYQLMRVCAPNIAAGNPVLAKHASIVPGSIVASQAGKYLKKSVMELGPLCSVPARNDIAAQVGRAVKAGATLHYGGSIIDRPGAFNQKMVLVSQPDKSETSL
jgi:acyl-CoA reductase-like NAD-dependent aldehyde dehydrogenase